MRRDTLKRKIKKETKRLQVRSEERGVSGRVENPSEQGGGDHHSS
jgi:hypothetical protein